MYSTKLELFHMKIYGIYLYTIDGDDARIIDSATDFSDLSWFYRSSFIEIANFTSKQLATSQNPQENVTADEKDFLFYAHREGNNCSIIVSTKDYPSRAAFSILREIMKEYNKCGGNFPNGKCQTIQQGIVDYQDPTKADKLLQIQSNLDEIQKIMIMSLEKAIGRGESIKELAERSKELSEQSRIFVRESSKLNKCCTII